MFLTGFFFAFVGAATAATEGTRKRSRGRSELRSGLTATACLHVSGCFYVFASIYEMPATEGTRKRSRGRSELHICCRCALVAYDVTIGIPRASLLVSGDSFAFIPFLSFYIPSDSYRLDRKTLWKSRKSPDTPP